MAELLDAGVDAVTITTPPETHRDLALEAITAGVHVIVDKPFAQSASQGLELKEAAEQAGVVIGVYHNRRWDGDIGTVADLIAEGRLGALSRLYSRFDLDELSSLRPGAANGLLMDLGSHLVDQLIWLLGPVASVTAHLNPVDLPGGGNTDGGFTLDLVHQSGVTSYAEASKANRVEARELRLYGSEGSYCFSDRTAGDKTGGNFGVLSTGKGLEKISLRAGRWSDFYTGFAAAVIADAAPPVTASEAVLVLQVLDAARKSALEGTTVSLSA
jgi:predicted dehydrogenase